MALSLSNSYHHLCLNINFFLAKVLQGMAQLVCEVETYTVLCFELDFLAVAISSIIVFFVLNVTSTMDQNAILS